jgi:hypothetical protein
MSSVEIVPAVQYSYTNIRSEQPGEKIEEIYIPSFDIIFNSKGQVLQFPDSDSRHPFHYDNDFIKKRTLKHINLTGDFARKMALIAKTRLEAEKKIDYKLRQLWDVDAIKQCKL